MENNENPIEKLLDTDNNEPIVLYDEKDNGIKFEQIALIPHKEVLYALLKPIEKMEGVADDEAVIFAFEEDANDNSQFLRVVNDDKIIDEVFAIYLKLAKEEEMSEKKPEKKEAKKAEKKPVTAKTAEKKTVAKKAPVKAEKKAPAKTEKKAPAKKPAPKKTVKK